MHSADALATSEYFWGFEGFFPSCFLEGKYPRFFKRKSTHVKPVGQYSFIHSFVHFPSQLPPSPMTPTLQELMVPSQVSSCLISSFVLRITPSSLKYFFNCLPGNHTSFLVFLLPWAALFQSLLLVLFISLTPKIRVPQGLVYGPLLSSIMPLASSASLKAEYT